MKILCNIHQPLSVDKRISGRIRPTQNWVGESLENATYVPPPPEDVTRLLNELLIFCNSKAEHTLDKCIECYARFVCIHPFADGNGRIARALFHTLLIKYGLDSVHLSLFRLRVPPVRYSNAIWAFGVTSEEGSKHPYWLEAKAWTAEYKINATNTLSAAQKIIFAKLGFSAITAEDKATLNYLWAQPLITPTLLQGTFGWSFTTVKASIEKLLQLGVLKRYQVKSSQNQSIFVCEDIFTCWEQLDELIFANGNKKK
ncbi:MAG: Fic family protein [Psychroserpens sp.]|jgi:Fic family protein